MSDAPEQDDQPDTRRFDATVDFLRRPESWPGGTERVEVVATHFACVFLTRHHAWKLKRPVKWFGLDQRTLAARERSCRRELVLNRRLAPSVYEAVVALVEEARGELAIGRRGETVDWLVKMRRLPAALMLDTLITGAGPAASRLEALADVLARFYRRGGDAGDGARSWLENVRARIREHARAVSDAVDDRIGLRVHDVRERLIGYTHDHARLLEERGRGGCVVEGHGDLRPEHVCLESEPVVIDCLEFDRDLRVLDRAEELAYLWLECEHLGNGSPGESVLRRCLDSLGDDAPPALLAFYRASRALLRARLALWHVGVNGHAAGAWEERAGLYLEMAEQFSHEAARRR